MPKEYEGEYEKRGNETRSTVLCARLCVLRVCGCVNVLLQCLRVWLARALVSV